MADDITGTPGSSHGQGGSMLRSTPSSHSKIDGNMKLSSGGSMTPEVSKEGWMRKKGSRVNMWGERYFSLKGSHLYYYLKSVDVVSSVFICISLLTIIRILVLKSTLIM